MQNTEIVSIFQVIAHPLHLFYISRINIYQHQLKDIFTTFDVCVCLCVWCNTIIHLSFRIRPQHVRPFQRERRKLIWNKKKKQNTKRMHKLLIYIMDRPLRWGVFHKSTYKIEFAYFFFLPFNLWALCCVHSILHLYGI